MSKFVESLSGEFANNWLVRVLSPAFVFWAVGFLAINGDLRNIDVLEHSLDRFESEKELHWIILLVLAFLLVSASAWIVDRITLPVTRLLEGYWWDFCGLWRWRVGATQRRYDKKYAEWNRLAALAAPSPKDKLRLIVLDQYLRRFPTADRLLPTRLGNILCASETRPHDKYGLDAVVCWPRLWLLLPDSNREDITAARAAMDDGVRLVLWSALSLVWSLWVCWLPAISLVVMIIGYRITLAAAADFADLLEAAFDTRRSLLYDALGWPLPETPAGEKAVGEALTKYLARGSDDNEPRLQLRRPANPAA